MVLFKINVLRTCVHFKRQSLIECHCKGVGPDFLISEFAVMVFFGMSLKKSELLELYVVGDYRNFTKSAKLTSSYHPISVFEILNVGSIKIFV